MLSRNALAELLSNPDLGNKERYLLCLAVDANRPKQTSDVAEIAIAAGFRANHTGISTYLGRTKGAVMRLKEGWILTTTGREQVRSLAGKHLNPRRHNVATDLRSLVARLGDQDAKEFLAEALACFESGFYRAAVVLSWVGAMSVLHQQVIDNYLAAYNQEALRRDAKWRPAKSKDDLGRMKEYDFLDVLVAISVIGKNVKDELQTCLGLRNGCGHPNSLNIGPNRVTAHIETLIQNVFARFT